MDALNAPLLVELLDVHSNIDATTLSALACTSKSFEAAVSLVWPDRERAYEESRNGANVPRGESLPLPMDHDVRLFPDAKTACTYELLERAEGKPLVVLEMDSDESERTRRNALMPGELAKRDYFLDTADLRLLRPFRDGKGPRWFRFEDVLSAAMLRHGRRRLADMMVARATKRGRTHRRQGERWRAVWSLSDRLLLPGEISTSVVRTYAEDYVRAGRGGIRGLRNRLIMQIMFSSRVHTRATPFELRGPLFPPDLGPLERNAIERLQIASVMTEDEALIEHAIDVVLPSRIVSGASIEAFLQDVVAHLVRLVVILVGVPDVSRRQGLPRRHPLQPFYPVGDGVRVQLLPPPALGDPLRRRQAHRSYKLPRIFMEGRREPAPMRGMDASVLVELLDNHSDIDATALSALACASNSFEAAVRSVWPARRDAYARSREGAAPEKRKALPILHDPMEMYPDPKEACRYHLRDRPRREPNVELHWNEKPMISFGWEQELSDWTRRTALVPVALARRAYFLNSKDLNMLQQYMDDAKARVRKERWHSVWDVVSTKGIAEDYLTMNVVYPYAKEFVDTGRGGIRGFEKRIRRHRTFSFLVSRGTVNAPLYLRPLERIMVSHLQLAYVLTRKDDFVADAQRVVRDLRIASGVVG
ncbi:hypothetical protein KFL_006200120 [Klebsormidium nitens]|uniref:Uncharacterized protein n=1 Tax=Klebsormidium nitens TaxID=105231 RepID=A0A1Y1IJG2_KLENI|nr:hypothetical protein KFL_006200120 [Klebsormidium nitens]|eukprot:GAQ90272.1 hypothetical protein KFL_006200120 [Klebsormidium nitens]